MDIKLKYRSSSAAPIPNSTTVSTSPLTSLEIDGNMRAIQEGIAQSAGTNNIGTDPNQIPLNQHLGSMAYVDTKDVLGDGLTVDERGRLSVRRPMFSVQELTPTSDTQTTFNVSHRVDNIEVYVNGILQYPSEYTSDGTKIILANTISRIDKLLVREWY